MPDPTVLGECCTCCFAPLFGHISRSAYQYGYGVPEYSSPSNPPKLYLTASRGYSTIGTDASSCTADPADSALSGSASYTIDEHDGTITYTGGITFAGEAPPGVNTCDNCSEIAPYGGTTTTTSTTRHITTSYYAPLPAGCTSTTSDLLSNENTQANVESLAVAKLPAWTDFIQTTTLDPSSPPPPYQIYDPPSYTAIMVGSTSLSVASSHLSWIGSGDNPTYTVTQGQYQFKFPVPASHYFALTWVEQTINTDPVAGTSTTSTVSKSYTWDGMVPTGYTYQGGISSPDYTTYPGTPIYECDPSAGGTGDGSNSIVTIQQLKYNCTNSSTTGFIQIVS